MDADDQIKTPVWYLKQGCDRPWEVDVEPFQVSPHTYYVGNRWVGCYLIRTCEGLILIDSTMHNQVYLVFESIRKLGLNPKDIKMLLISHAHYDHCGGARPIVEYTSAKLYMGKEDEYFLTERPDLIYTEGYPFGTFQVDEYFADDKPITLGEITIHTLHTPGHTPGTRSFFFDDIDSAGNVYHCGLHGGIGLNTLDDNTLKESGWSVSLRNDFLDGLLKLREMKIDITLASHPDQTCLFEKMKHITNDFNPFVDPAEWKKLVDSRIVMIKEMIRNSDIV